MAEAVRLAQLARALEERERRAGPPEQQPMRTAARRPPLDADAPPDTDTPPDTDAFGNAARGRDTGGWEARSVGGQAWAWGSRMCADGWTAAWAEDGQPHLPHNPGSSMFAASASQEAPEFAPETVHLKRAGTAPAPTRPRSPEFEWAARSGAATIPASAISTQLARGDTSEFEWVARGNALEEAAQENQGSGLQSHLQQPWETSTPVDSWDVTQLRKSARLAFERAPGNGAGLSIGQRRSVDLPVNVRARSAVEVASEVEAAVAAMRPPGRRSAAELERRLRLELQMHEAMLQMEREMRQAERLYQDLGSNPQAEAVRQHYAFDANRGGVVATRDSPILQLQKQLEARQSEYFARTSHLRSMGVGHQTSRRTNEQNAAESSLRTEGVRSELADEARTTGYEATHMVPVDASPSQDLAAGESLGNAEAAKGGLTAFTVEDVEDIDDTDRAPDVEQTIGDAEADAVCDGTIEAEAESVEQADAIAEVEVFDDGPATDACEGALVTMTESRVASATSCRPTTHMASACCADAFHTPASAPCAVDSKQEACVGSDYTSLNTTCGLHVSTSCAGAYSGLVEARRYFPDDEVAYAAQGPSGRIRLILEGPPEPSRIERYALSVPPGVPGGGSFMANVGGRVTRIQVPNGFDSEATDAPQLVVEVDAPLKEVGLWVVEVPPNIKPGESFHAIMDGNVKLVTMPDHSHKHTLKQGLQPMGWAPGGMQGSERSCGPRCQASHSGQRRSRASVPYLSDTLDETNSTDETFGTSSNDSWPQVVDRDGLEADSLPRDLLVERELLRQRLLLLEEKRLRGDREGQLASRVLSRLSAEEENIIARGNLRQQEVNAQRQAKKRLRGLKAKQREQLRKAKAQEARRLAHRKVALALAYEQSMQVTPLEDLPTFTRDGPITAPLRSTSTIMESDERREMVEQAQEGTQLAGPAEALCRRDDDAMLPSEARKSLALPAESMTDEKLLEGSRMSTRQHFMLELESRKTGKMASPTQQLQDALPSGTDGIHPDGVERFSGFNSTNVLAESALVPGATSHGQEDSYKLQQTSDVVNVHTRADVPSPQDSSGRVSSVYDEEANIDDVMGTARIAPQGYDSCAATCQEPLSSSVDTTPQKAFGASAIDESSIGESIDAAHMPRMSCESWVSMINEESIGESIEATHRLRSAGESIASLINEDSIGESIDAAHMSHPGGASVASVIDEVSMDESFDPMLTSGKVRESYTSVIEEEGMEDEVSVVEESVMGSQVSSDVSHGEVQSESSAGFSGIDHSEFAAQEQALSELKKQLLQRRQEAQAILQEAHLSERMQKKRHALALEERELLAQLHACEQIIVKSRQRVNAAESDLHKQRRTPRTQRINDHLEPASELSVASSIADDAAKEDRGSVSSASVVEELDSDMDEEIEEDAIDGVEEDSIVGVLLGSAMAVDDAAESVIYERSSIGACAPHEATESIIEDHFATSAFAPDDVTESIAFDRSAASAFAQEDVDESIAYDRTALSTRAPDDVDESIAHERSAESALANDDVAESIAYDRSAESVLAQVDVAESIAFDPSAASVLVHDELGESIAYGRSVESAFAPGEVAESIAFDRTAMSARGADDVDESIAYDRSSVSALAFEDVSESIAFDRSAMSVPHVAESITYNRSAATARTPDDVDESFAFDHVDTLASDHFVESIAYERSTLAPDELAESIIQEHSIVGESVLEWQGSQGQCDTIDEATAMSIELSISGSSTAGARILPLKRGALQTGESSIGMDDVPEESPPGSEIDEIPSEIASDDDLSPSDTFAQTNIEEDDPVQESPMSHGSGMSESMIEELDESQDEIAESLADDSHSRSSNVVMESSAVELDGVGSVIESSEGTPIAEDSLEQKPIYVNDESSILRDDEAVDHEQSASGRPYISKDDADSKDESQEEDLKELNRREQQISQLTDQLLHLMICEAAQFIQVKSNALAAASRAAIRTKATQPLGAMPTYDIQDRASELQTSGVQTVPPHLDQLTDLMLDDLVQELAQEMQLWPRTSVQLGEQLGSVPVNHEGVTEILLDGLMQELAMEILSRPKSTESTSRSVYPDRIPPSRPTLTTLPSLESGPATPSLIQPAPKEPSKSDPAEHRFRARSENKAQALTRRESTHFDVVPDIAQVNTFLGDLRAKQQQTCGGLLLDKETIEKMQPHVLAEVEIPESKERSRHVRAWTNLVAAAWNESMTALLTARKQALAPLALKHQLTMIPPVLLERWQKMADERTLEQIAAMRATLSSSMESKKDYLDLDEEAQYKKELEDVKDLEAFVSSERERIKAAVHREVTDAVLQRLLVETVQSLPT